MKSEWRVTSQYIDDIPQFAVYRLRNINAVDHSGNREYYGGYTPDEGEAEELARKLNAEERRITERKVYFGQEIRTARGSGNGRECGQGVGGYI